MRIMWIHRTKNTLWVVLSLLGMLSLSGCCCCCGLGDRTSDAVRNINAGPVHREEQTIELQDAERVNVALTFLGGELSIDSRDDLDLFSGEFVYNLDELAPLVEYEVDEEQGELVIQHQNDQVGWNRFRDQVRNEWTLAFAQDVSLSISMDVGASEGKLELGGIQLTGMDLDAGAADLTIRFDQSNLAQMESLDIQSGAARLRFEQLGNANLSEMTFDGGVGTYHFDFGGDWQRSAQVVIESGVSEIVLRLPSDIGVRLCPNRPESGKYGKLTQEGECYVNSAYAEADIRLELELDVGLSSIRVE